MYVIECGEGTYGLLGSPLEIKATPETRGFTFSMSGVCDCVGAAAVTLDDFTADAIKSPDILDLRPRRCEIDHAFDRGDQGIEPARITLRWLMAPSLSSSVICPREAHPRAAVVCRYRTQVRESAVLAEQPITSAKAQQLVETGRVSKIWKTRETW